MKPTSLPSYLFTRRTEFRFQHGSSFFPSNYVSSNFYFVCVLKSFIGEEQKVTEIKFIDKMKPLVADEMFPEGVDVEDVSEEL